MISLSTEPVRQRPDRQRWRRRRQKQLIKKWIFLKIETSSFRTKLLRIHVYQPLRFITA